MKKLTVFAFLSVVTFSLASCGVGDSEDPNEIIKLKIKGAKGGEFKDILDFCKRVSMRVVNKRVIENLIKCGAMDSLKCKRSQLLAILDQIVEIANSYQKDYASGQIDLFGEENFFLELQPSYHEEQKYVNKNFRNNKITVCLNNGETIVYDGPNYIYYNESTNVSDKCFHFVDDKELHHRIYGDPIIIVDEF